MRGKAIACLLYSACYWLLQNVSFDSDKLGGRTDILERWLMNSSCYTTTTDVQLRISDNPPVCQQTNAVITPLTHAPEFTTAVPSCCRFQAGEIVADCVPVLWQCWLDDWQETRPGRRNQLQQSRTKSFPGTQQRFPKMLTTLRFKFDEFMCSLLLRDQT